MLGAPLLAGEAALRTGAGVVTIASHAEVIDKLEMRVREVMTLQLPVKNSEAVKVLTTFIRDRCVSVLVLGPGQNADFAKLNEPLLSNLDIPAVIDAGALNAFIGRLATLEKLADSNNQLILTPHAGEYQRLAGATLPTNRTQLRRTVSDFTRTQHLTLVLKGSQTLVCHPDGRLYENTTGNPGLATAGTGDVLSGVIAGLLAQGLPPNQAAEAGVYLHGLAGDLAAEIKTQPGLIASDVIHYLPTAFKSLSL